MLKLMNSSKPSLRLGHSLDTSAHGAVSEFSRQMQGEQWSCIYFFCSIHYDLPALAKEIHSAFPHCNVVGCTTAGEIGPLGYVEKSLVGFGLKRGHFAVASHTITSFGHESIDSVRRLVENLLVELKKQDPNTSVANTFALLLIDGLSVREEATARIVQTALGPIPLIGGSAGDGFNFLETYVFSQGEFKKNTAVLTLVSTRHKFITFLTQHFETTDKRVVVTSADPAQRIVYELDGLPASEVYATLAEVPANLLDSKVFATYPMAVHIGGANYVRSISHTLPNGALKFFCTIEEGVVLRLVQGTNILPNLKQFFHTINSDIGIPALVIGCDCALRQLEINQNHLQESVSQLMHVNNVCGFSTYGEQYKGIHMNQTFTGIAIADD